MSATILMAVTNNMLFAVANVIQGIEKHSTYKFKYVVLVEKKNLCNQQELNALISIVPPQNEGTRRIAVLDFDYVFSNDLIDFQQSGMDVMGI